MPCVRPLPSFATRPFPGGTSASHPILAEQSVAKRAPADRVLLASVLVLVALGVVAVYSASAVYAHRTFGSQTHFLVRQVVYVGLGFVALGWAATHDYTWLRRRNLWLLGLAVALLGAVLLFGARINHARRWLQLGPLSFQPVELAKLALAAYLAAFLSRKHDAVKSFTVGFLPPLLVCGGLAGLLLLEPDLGSCVIMGLTTIVLLFVAGTRLSYLLLAFLVVVPAGYLAVVGTPWRLRRLLAFLDPWLFRSGVGYQVTQSLIALGSGGAFGLGLGGGNEKLFYLAVSSLEPRLAERADRRPRQSDLYTLDPEGMADVVLFIHREKADAVHVLVARRQGGSACEVESPAPSSGMAVSGG